MPIPKDTKKVTHKDYQTRQWPMLQPFPARTEKLERHIVLEKGFRKIQKTTCDFNIHFKNFSICSFKIFQICSFKIYHMVLCSSPLENLFRIHNNFSQLSQINIVLALICRCNKMLKEICALDNSNIFQNSSAYFDVQFPQVLPAWPPLLFDWARKLRQSRDRWSIF